MLERHLRRGQHQRLDMQHKLADEHACEGAILVLGDGRAGSTGLGDRRLGDERLQLVPLIWLQQPVVHVLHTTPYRLFLTSQRRKYLSTPMRRGSPVASTARVPTACR